MCVSLRRFGAVVLGLLAVLGPSGRQGTAQQPAPGPLPPPANAAMNPNFYANPFATRGQFNNAAVLGSNLQNAPVAANAARVTASWHRATCRPWATALWPRRMPAAWVTAR